MGETEINLNLSSDISTSSSPRLTTRSPVQILIPPPPAHSPSPTPTPSTSTSKLDQQSTPSTSALPLVSPASPASPRKSFGFVSGAVAAFELEGLGDEDDDPFRPGGRHDSFNVEEIGSDSEEALLIAEEEGGSPAIGMRDHTGGRSGGGSDQRKEALKKHPKEGIDQEWKSRGAGLLAGIANMSNSILGAGIIALPYALREAGLFTGTILIIILGFTTDWTIRLILLTSKMSGRSTYIDIMDACFGPAGRLAVSICQFTFALGGMIAFSIILGDTIPHVLQAIIPTSNPVIDFFTGRTFIVIVLTMGVSYPLSLYREIEKLSKASALALISMVVIIVSVAIRGPQIDESLKGDQTDRWNFANPGVFEAIGVISFAFVCHHNSLLIYGSLSIPTLDRFARVTHISTALSVFACLAMSMSGYLVFTSSTQGNILNNFATDDALINVARACLGANMFATLPLEAFVCREVLESYFWPGKEFSQKRHFIITTCLVIFALLASLITCDLGLILELAGGTSATGLAYIFPAACYLKLSTKKRDATRVAAWICCCFGLVVMVLSTFFSISRAISGTKPQKIC